MTWAVAGLSALILVVWIYRNYLFSWSMKHDPVLRPESGEELPAHPPMVSIIVPARNEEHNLQACLESLLVQNYPAFEVLVFDDRSTDGTAGVVRSFADRDPRVRLLRNGETPEGWTGKNYVLHLAAEQARGEYLLFVDADTRHDPASLRRSMGHALVHGADMFSLILPLENVRFWEKVVQPLAGGILTMWYPLWKVNDPKSRIAFANGQYILFRRQAYEQVGGHRAVKGELLEDIALARRVKEAGLKLRVGYGLGIARSRMYSTFTQIVHGWTRILFVGFGRSAARLTLAVVMLLLFSCFPYAALAGAAVWWLAAGPSTAAGMVVVCNLLSIAAVNLFMLRLYHAFRCGTPYALAHPLASVVVLWILLAGIRMRFSTRGLVWRGVRYETRPAR